MKRIRFLAILLTLLLSFTAIACTNDPTNEDSTPAATQEQTAASGESSADPFVKDKESWN